MSPIKIMKIVTFNVNGLHSHCESGNTSIQLKEYFEYFDADIVCLQEIKMSKDGLTKSSNNFINIPGYHSFYSLENGPIYGVASFVRYKYSPLNVEDNLAQKNSLIDRKGVESLTTEKGLGPLQLLELDDHARVLITDHQSFVLFNIYSIAVFPLNPEESHMDEKRAKITSQLRLKRLFEIALEHRVSSLIKQGKRVIVVGDLNVVLTEMDCGLLPSAEKSDSFTFFKNLPSRKWLSKWVSSKETEIIDTFRHFKPCTPLEYTRFSENRRRDNRGTRLDYILASSSLLPFFKSTTHLSGILGSDHCPVISDLFDVHPEAGHLLYEAPIPITVPPAGHNLLCTYHWPSYNQISQSPPPVILRSKKRKQEKEEEVRVIVLEERRRSRSEKKNRARILRDFSMNYSKPVLTFAQHQQARLSIE